MKPIIGMLLLALMTGPSLAGANDLGGNGYYPDGFPAFCEHYPGECQSATPVTVSAAKWKDTLVRINRDVNERIKYRAEPDGQDEWVINPEYGDCEDYAITKRSELAKLGFPRGAMRLGFVTSQRTGRHLVLIVSTDGGDRILDSANKLILTPDKTSYAWKGVQDAANPHIWSQVEVKNIPLKVSSE